MVDNCGVVGVETPSTSTKTTSTSRGISFDTAASSDDITVGVVVTRLFFDLLLIEADLLLTLLLGLGLGKNENGLLNEGRIQEAPDFT